MNGTKSAKEYRKGERLEITEEKMTEETLEKKNRRDFSGISRREK